MRTLNLQHSTLYGRLLPPTIEGKAISNSTPYEVNDPYELNDPEESFPEMRISGASDMAKTQNDSIVIYVIQRVQKKDFGEFSMLEFPTLESVKFRSAYKEITEKDIKVEEIPPSLQKCFRTSQSLSGKEFIKLPENVRTAYFMSQKSPDNVIWDKIKKRLSSYENKYEMSSEEFYCKHHNSESLYKGSPEQVDDFLLWHSDYRRYLELKDVIR